MIGESETTDFLDLVERHRDDIASATRASTRQRQKQYRGNINEVTVAYRVRPVLGEEKPLIGSFCVGSTNASFNQLEYNAVVAAHASVVVLEEERAIGQLTGNVVRKTFQSDRVFGPLSTDAEVYRDLVSPLVEHALRGFCSTLLCFGQTASGKTFTAQRQLRRRSRAERELLVVRARKIVARNLSCAGRRSAETDVHVCRYRIPWHYSALLCSALDKDPCGLFLPPSLARRTRTNRDPIRTAPVAALLHTRVGQWSRIVCSEEKGAQQRPVHSASASSSFVATRLSTSSARGTRSRSGRGQTATSP